MDDSLRMSFPRLYRAIDDMLENTAKHTLLAREIVRKSGVKAGAAASGAIAPVGNALQWLIDIWYERQTYNQPNNSLQVEIGDDGIGPFTIAKMVPKKLSDEDFDITYMRETTSSGSASQATYDIYECAPTYWGLGGEYPPGSNITTPPALDPGGTQDRSNSSYEVRPYITGATSYDPFPYPEYPNYFWADLRYCNSIYIFYARRGAGGARTVMGPTVPVGGSELGFEESVARFTQINSTLQEYENFIWFGIMASLDGGETWEGPMAGLESHVQEGYPYWGGDHTKPMYYREFAEINLLGTAPGPYYVSWSPTLQPLGLVKNKFRVENVLMKFVLWGALTTERIYLTHWGVRGVYRLPSGDERTFTYRA